MWTTTGPPLAGKAATERGGCNRLLLPCRCLVKPGPAGKPPRVRSDDCGLTHTAVYRRCSGHGVTAAGTLPALSASRSGSATSIASARGRDAHAPSGACKDGKHGRHATGEGPLGSRFLRGARPERRQHPEGTGRVLLL